MNKSLFLLTVVSLLSAASLYSMEADQTNIPVIRTIETNQPTVSLEFITRVLERRQESGTCTPVVLFNSNELLQKPINVTPQGWPHGTWHHGTKIFSYNRPQEDITPESWKEHNATCILRDLKSSASRS